MGEKKQTQKQDTKKKKISKIILDKWKIFWIKFVFEFVIFNNINQRTKLKIKLEYFVNNITV